MHNRFGKLICACGFWALSTVAAVGAGTADLGPETEFHRYLERTGDAIRPISWCAARKDVTRLIYSGPGDIHVTETDGALATTRWRMGTADGSTSVSALREGDGIAISGIVNGQPVVKRLWADSDPWFQAASLSLRRFVLSAQTRIDYWFVRPDTMTLHKIRAQKKAVEEVVAAGAKHQAQVIELRLSGALAPFWSARYWFRSQDGVFLRFEGPSGAPGKPTLVISYEGPAQACDAVDETGVSMPP